jgi:FkbM family methyltransferase
MFNCGLIDIGWNLQELYIRLCKENKIANMERYIYFCSNNINDSNKNDEELTLFYNACDVGITTSTGESFGLIPFEQSALGIPQIIPNWGGIIESIRYGSIKVETNDYYVYPVVLQSSNGEARTVYYKDVSKAMEAYLLDKELYELHSREVLKNVQHYNWENIYLQLVHFLNEIAIYKNSIPIKEVKLRNDVSFKMTLYNDNDFISSLIYKYGIWEESNTNYILDLMKENQNTDAIIVDIGANIGYYSLLSAAMGYTCYSFEPDPSNFEKFNSSIKLNNFDNKIKLYKNALSNKANETIILSTVAGPIVNHGCLTVLKDFIPNSSNTVQCVTLKLDDVINKKDEILLIKIDIEGFEPEVIEGSAELLKTGNIRHILIEISPKFRKIEDYIKMICILAQNNFTKILNLDSRKILNYEELIKELPSLPKGQCDYLFFHEKDNKNNKIPKKIWQTWHTKDISIEMKANIELLKTQHSDFEYNLYDIEDSRDFIGKHFPEEILNTYDNLIPYAYKSDLFRYCILYIYGGIYLDVKYQFCNSFHLNYLIDREHFVLDRPGFALPGNISIQNGFIITRTGNPILLDSINEIVLNVRNNYYGHSSLCPTGPCLLGVIYRKYYKTNEFMMYFNNEGTMITYDKLPILKFYDTYYTKDNIVNNTKVLRYVELFDLKQIYKPHVDKLDIPIWCINLEKNTNRKQHIIDGFGKQNIHFEFINAVDGVKIDFRSPEYKSLFTDFGLNKIYSDVKEHGHDLTIGGAGLILTVKDVWNKITVPTLIFEDDVELCEHFDSQLSNITAQLPTNWDIVYIGYYHDPKIQQINEHIWTANKVYGLYGYLIHPNYAKKILTNTFPCNYQIDTEINRFNANSNCFVVYPPLVSPSNKFTTDIQIFDIHPIINK